MHAQGGARGEERPEGQGNRGAASTTSNASTAAILVTVGAAKASMGISETYP